MLNSELNLLALNTVYHLIIGAGCTLIAVAIYKGIELYKARGER